MRATSGLEKLYSTRLRKKKKKAGHLIPWERIKTPMKLDVDSDSSTKNTSNFRADGRGTKAVFDGVDRAMSEYRRLTPSQKMVRKGNFSMTSKKPKRICVIDKAYFARDPESFVGALWIPKPLANQIKKFEKHFQNNSKGKNL